MITYKLIKFHHLKQRDWASEKVPILSILQTPVQKPIRSSISAAFRGLYRQQLPPLTTSSVQALPSVFFCVLFYLPTTLLTRAVLTAFYRWEMGGV